MCSIDNSFNKKYNNFYKIFLEKDLSKENGFIIQIYIKYQKKNLEIILNYILK